MLRGCGEDAEGNIYVAISEETFQHSGAQIQCYGPDGITPQWDVHSFFHCDLADFEPGTDGTEITRTQRHKMIGNGFTIPIVAHILSPLVNEFARMEEMDYADLSRGG